MPMYNFLEYNENYSMASGSLWNYYRDEAKIYISSNENYFQFCSLYGLEQLIKYPIRVS